MLPIPAAATADATRVALPPVLPLRVPETPNGETSTSGDDGGRGRRTPMFSWAATGVGSAPSDSRTVRVNWPSARIGSGVGARPTAPLRATGMANVPTLPPA